MDLVKMPEPNRVTESRHISNAYGCDYYIETTRYSEQGRVCYLSISANGADGYRELFHAKVKLADWKAIAEAVIRSHMRA